MKHWLKLGLAALLAFALTGEASAQKGRSYSSGSSSYSSGSRSSGSSSYSSGSSGSKYSSGSSSSSSSGSKYSSGSSSSNSSSSGKYSSGSSSNSNSSKPSTSSWNPGLSATKQREDSQRNYQAATKPAATPKSTYVTPKGETKTVDSNSKSVTTVRNYVTHERYVTYDNRASTFYPPVIYSHPQPYNDFFSPFLMGYLFHEAITPSDRAMWVYNHRSEIDDARYRDMIAKDAQLEARIRELEKQGVQRDAGYVLPTMKDNPDLQYSKEYVDSCYNPVHEEHHGSGFWHGVGQFLFWTVVVLVGGLIVFAIIYYVFVREY